MGHDKHGSVSILDPLIAPEPSDDTGLNSHFRSSYAAKPSSSVVRSSSMSSPRSRHSPTSPSGPSNGNGTPTRTRQRGNSLSERFPGDMSHKPLDMIRRDSKRAHRSPHLKKSHIPRADTIDRLDPTLGASYHHEGPYDAALWTRNTSFETSPVAALADSNEEAIKATPRENLLDSVRRHRPLDGVGAIPPGEKDRFGRAYNYQEGPNMMIEDGGDYKRWPGIPYHPDDVKGKGEPSYSLEKALKEHKIHGSPDDEHGFEMQPRPSVTGIDQGGPVGDPDHPARQSGHHKRNSLEGIKRRIGSLRRKKD